MPSWLIRLKGERFDLEELLKEFRSPKVKIKEENGSFYLESNEFNKMDSANEVLKKGKAIIRQINIVSKFNNNNNYLDVTEDVITQVKDDGTKHNYVFLGGSVRLRTKFNAQLKVTNSHGPNKTTNQASSSESILKLVEKNDIVAKALSFYNENTCFGLYKSYEIIADDIGDEYLIIKNGWSTKKDLKRFIRSINHPDILGDSARHAINKFEPPKKPMEFSEAKKYIKNILKKWLVAKK
jgi:hypothetical protein